MNKAEQRKSAINGTDKYDEVVSDLAEYVRTLEADNARLNTHICELHLELSMSSAAYANLRHDKTEQTIALCLLIPVCVVLLACLLF